MNQLNSATSIKRAGVILTTLYFLAYISTSTTIFLAYKKGIIQQAYAYTAPKIVDFIEKLNTPSKPAPSVTPISKPIIKATPTPTPKPVVRQQTIIIQQTPTTSTTSTFDQEAWDAKVDQMHQDYLDRVEQMKADSDAAAAENAAAADEWYEQKKAEAEAERDAWLEEHGF